MQPGDRRGVKAFHPREHGTDTRLGQRLGGVCRRALGVCVLAIVAALDVTPRAAAAQRPATIEVVPAGAGARHVVRCGALVLLVSTVLIGIRQARRGRALPIREIPGLTAFEEAVARATEMGRPTLFTVGGACDLKKVQLYASMPMLREVSRLSGELSNRLIVPVCYAEALPVHLGAIRDGYADAGTADEVRAEDVRFFPGGQFFFAMASMGWMLSERPAACFYFGWWEADALMFAETGQVIEALQIAGTDQLYQIPFFVAACDYTLIGEEFWAASAKLGRDPQLLGSIGAQDVLKVAMVVLIVIGSALCAIPSIADRIASWKEIFRG